MMSYIVILMSFTAIFPSIGYGQAVGWSDGQSRQPVGQAAIRLAVQHTVCSLFGQSGRQAVSCRDLCLKYFLEKDSMLNKSVIK